MTIDMYAVEGPDGFDSGVVYKAEEYEDAKRDAQARGGAVICYEFEFSDSYCVDDYRREKATSARDSSSRVTTRP